jgi:DNA-binding HxlR family transcriptional regulator
MASPEDRSEFNEARAELFETLGHQTRIRILQALSRKPMGFAELKRETGIESGGLLSFHLGKLGHLVKTTSEGDYDLSDEGREALRVIGTISSEEREGRVRPKVLSGGSRLKIVAAVLVIALVALGGLGLYQQQQIATLSSELSGDLSGTVSMNGHSFWYLTLPSQMVTGAANGTTISFHGVKFTLYNPGSYSTGGSVFIAPASNFTVILAVPNGTPTYSPSTIIVYNATASCSSGCSNSTFVTFALKGVAVNYFVLPKVQITMPSGQSEVLLLPQSSQGVTSYAVGGSSFWFTPNTSPVVGVSVNGQTGTVTFYVQAAG